MPTSPRETPTQSIAIARRAVNADIFRRFCTELLDSDGYSAATNRDYFDHGQAIGPAPLAIVFRLVGDPSTYARRIVPTLSVPPELYVAFTLNDMGLDVTALDTWTLTEDDVL